MKEERICTDCNVRPLEPNEEKCPKCESKRNKENKEAVKGGAIFGTIILVATFAFKLIRGGRNSE
ncbi:MAG: hypothetical protein KAI79_00790 [Bacteroidales bacterium]|nr:hypothetical protein [Bacteroidales bacterium]